MSPVPDVLWQGTQFAANICEPEFASPVRLTASPGPPGLDGRGTPDDAEGVALVEPVAPDVAVAAAGAVVGAAATGVEAPVAEAETGFKLITYEITSAICCCVSLFESPHGGMENVGLGPAGVEPC